MSDDEKPIFECMEKMVRRLAQNYTFDELGNTWQEAASDIVRALDRARDPDIHEAERLYAANYRKVNEGTLVLLAIKRGRELERLGQ